MVAGVTPTLMEIFKHSRIKPWLLYREETTVEETLKIIEDALSHGFEFKVENGKLYFREI